jgi:hypothetical protein
MGRVNARRTPLAGHAAFLGLLCALLCALATNAVASEVPGGELLVTRSEEALDCPDERALLAATLALGTVPPDPTAEPVRVEVSFARDLDGYAATIRSSGRKEGVRELARADPSCASLGDATAVVVAVLFDLVPPDAPVPATSPPAEPLPEVLRPVASEGERPPVEVPRNTPPFWTTTPFSTAFGIYGGVSYGLLGNVVAGSIAAAGRPRWGRFELGVGALFVPEREFAHGVGFVDVMLLTGRLEGCAWLTPLSSSVGAGLCGGLMLGMLRGEGRNFFRDAPASDLWSAADAAGFARFEVYGPWALRLGVRLVVPLRQYTFSTTDTGVAFETAPAAVLAEVGPEVHFP